MATDPDRLLAIPGDIRDESRNRAIVDEVLSRFGRIDGLVNNAGIRRDSLMYNMSAEQWAEVVETNLHGAFSMTRAVLVPMMKQRRGAILNVASISGMHGVVGQTNYSAAKGGLIAMTKSLAREVARSGIRVNCVAPGLVETDMIAGLILVSSYGVLSESATVLLEGTPAGTDMPAVIAAIKGVAGVLDVHDLHVWMVGPGVVACSCHIIVAEQSVREGQQVLRAVVDDLKRRFHITHTTVQVEVEGCEDNDMYCIAERSPRRA